ncbi:DUF2339 domain-containing protein [Mycolicibacterium komossense]|uniref:DUF2339 domain-containing protein n=1 Tax=Mycolicibacterium komossense TaxID=1779 RepID=A0ABT3CB64_9MYCO|nr:DUF2339 domain-containing protein [Mycolicibacterium komossense]MCV7226715.1 DUF2339 domain-containing protein [Mycolicibacterium komossense]
MTEPHQAALHRLSEEFTAMSRQLARVATQLSELERTMPAAPAQQPYPGPVFTPPAAAPPMHHPQYQPQTAPPSPQPAPPAAYLPPRAPGPPKRSLAERISAAGERGLIGKLLAVAGVAVTLIGVVLLVVLAAQAGILRPEIRVGAGAVLAGGLVAIADRLNRRAGGRIGAIALAATGIAAAYIDVIAITTVYHWVAPGVSLIIASVVGGGGLVLARHWDSEQLGLLVLVPLLVLAPIVTGGITLTLIAFMLVLSAASLPVQLGKDWVWMHAARTTAVTLPLLLALLINRVVTGDDPWLIGAACGIAAALAIVGALILMPWITSRVVMALVTVAGVLPALAAGVTGGRVLAALLAAAVAVAMLAIVVTGRIPGVTGAVRQIWSALSAVSALIAVTVAFNGLVAGPVLLAMATVVTIAGREHRVARWAAIGFVVVGAAFFVGSAPPRYLTNPTVLPTSVAVSTLAASLLMIAVAVAIAWSWTAGEADLDDGIRLLWTGVVAVTAYCVTTFTVTAGVLMAGLDGGFLAGHMAATIGWIAIAAGLFVYALRVAHRDARTAPIAGGLALTAAAMVKLFLFDLGTLDGIFRVVAFIVVGLALLGMGSGYARSLAQQDR